MLFVVASVSAVIIIIIIIGGREVFFNKIRDNKVLVKWEVE